MALLEHLNTPADARTDVDPVHFTVERFEYAPADLLLRLSVCISLELPSSAHPLLIIEREAIDYGYAPLLFCAGRAPLKDSDEWIWRGAFAVPLDFASDPRALFALRLGDQVHLALPGPSLRVLCKPQPGQREEPRRRWASARTWPCAVRRSALLCVITCQLGVVSGWSSAAALGSGSPGTGTGAEPTPEAPPIPTAGGSSEPTPEVPPKERGTSQPSTTTSTTPAPSSTSTTTPAPTATRAAATPAAPTVALQGSQKTTAAEKVRHNITVTEATPSTRVIRGAPAGVNDVALPPRVVAAEAGALASELAGSASPQALHYYRIPLFLLPIYKAAAAQYGVPWQILAAINEIETNYGSDLSVSTAGAVGWMQFMPATWLHYGVDAVNAGYADPYNPVDAIFAAARYLRAAGARSNLPGAILAYNHSAEYVNSVLLRAKLISTYPKLVMGTLTGLTDARLPVTGKQLAWRMLTPATSASSPTADATALERNTGALASAAARPAFSAPPSPSGAAAAVIGAEKAATQPPQLVDLMSTRNAAVVAVQDGRIMQLGSSRKLGKYVVLRDIYGDVFTYAGVGSIARSCSLPPSAPPTKLGARGADRRSVRANHALPLRTGSVVAKGTVLGRVRVPRGAKDGHLHFAVRPAGDANTIDPRPILANWTQLNTALHPQGAKGDASLLGATAGLTKAAHSAAAGRIAPSTLVVSGGLTSGQWSQLIVRIAALPVPKVAVEPSSAAISDPQATSSSSGLGEWSLSSGH